MLFAPFSSCINQLRHNITTGTNTGNNTARSVSRVRANSHASHGNTLNSMARTGASAGSVEESSGGRRGRGFSAQLERLKAKRAAKEQSSSSTGAAGTGTSEDA